jgi:pSer/pThr/pTyr-binding forkhead associated (FHA) protein
VIGRDPVAELSLPDDGLVSYRHARAVPTDDGLLIEDLGSRNGTFVNGAQLEAPTLVGSGDRIVVGETTIEVELPGVSEPAPPAGEYLLLVSTAGEPVHEVPLGDPLEIGRDPAAGLPLPDAQVSWRHARLSPRPDGVEVRDLGSRNGTFVDGERIGEATVVAPGSRVIVGESAIEVAARGRVETAVAPSFLSANTVASAQAPLGQLVLEIRFSDGTSRELPLGAPLEIGRDPSAELVLDDQLVSRMHARLIPGAEQVTVEDLGSRNGTFVNGAPIKAPAVVGPGDQIVVGETTILVGLTGTPAPQAHTAVGELPLPASERRAGAPEPSAPEPSAPQLVVQVIEGWSAGRQFRLTGPLEVGRDPSAGVPLVEDDRVSQRHARLTPSSEGVFVEDLGSSEGTFVNDARIDGRTLVVVGDRILVGRTVLRLRAAADTPSGLSD